MADIELSDNVGVTGDLQIRDDSPLAKAKLNQLATSVKSFLAGLTNPVDQADFKTVDFGITLNSSSIPVGETSAVPISGGLKACLSVIRSADGPLFDDDGFSPIVSIAKNECWMAFELDVTIDANAAASIDGFGIGVDGATVSALTTYCLMTSSGNVFPSLKDSVERTLNCYSLSCSPDAIRKQTPGTVNVANLSGTITFSGSYALPINVNALATAKLPFNYSIALQPSVTLGVTGSISLTGEFVVRCYKESDSRLTLGVYKKKGTELTACLTAGAGLEAEHGSTDLLGAFLTATVGKIDFVKAGIPSDTAKQLQDALKTSINRSLSVSMNVECTSSNTDEAAAIFSIDLSAGDFAQTDAAIASALKGDWAGLSMLPNAKEIRNIVKTTKETRCAIETNLLGIYNTDTVDDFVKSCSILHDENGRIVVTDTDTASRIAVADVPFGADADKLRRALAQAFLCTVTYTAGSPGSPSLKTDLAVSQTYFRYAANMSTAQMRHEVLLGTALSMIPGGQWDTSLASNAKFKHVKVSAQVRYGRDASFRLFFSDPVNRIPYSRAELEKIGRDVMASLILAADPGGSGRLSALHSDDIWKAMDEMGVVANFGQIPGLERFNQPTLGAIGADWIDIEWWVDAMTKVAPRLNDVLIASEASTGDPTKNANWLRKRASLANALADVARNTSAAFAEGWGLAVMFALSGKQAEGEMDLCAGGRQEHYSWRQPAVLTGRTA